MAPRSDRGTGAVGWLLRIALVVGSLGVVGYDAAAIGVGHLTLDDTAAAAALEGRQAIAETRDTRRG